MEAVILIGIQGSGKSTFVRRRLFDTHVRINRDMLKTARREKLLLQACLDAKQPFVVDKMNLTPEARRRYIEGAKAAGFRVVGYCFESDLAACRRRNAQRPADKVIPVAGLASASRRLTAPSLEEGFDALYAVRIADDGRFDLWPWPKAPDPL